jgi:hypothetical protein
LIEFLPHRSFTPAYFDPPGPPVGAARSVRLEEVDWVLAFKENGGAPIRFQLKTLLDKIREDIQSIIDPNEVFWWVPLATVKKGDNTDGDKLAMSTDLLDNVDGIQADGTNILTPGNLTSEGNKYRTVKMNQSRHTQDYQLLPAYILEFVHDIYGKNNSVIGGHAATAISYHPSMPEYLDGSVTKTSDVTIKSRTDYLYDSNGPKINLAQDGPQVFMNFKPGKHESGDGHLTAGMMVRAAFKQSGIPTIARPLQWLSPSRAGMFSSNATNVTTDITDTDVSFLLASQDRSSGLGTTKKHQPWLTHLLGLHDTPTNLAAEFWPRYAGQGYNMGKWWSSENSTPPGGNASWTNLTSDRAGQEGEANAVPGSSWASWAYNRYRDYYSFLITAHWGLKNLKPCMIVWDSDMGKTEDDFPSQRPKNWLYRGEALQPGDMYFYIF